MGGSYVDYLGLAGGGLDDFDKVIEGDNWDCLLSDQIAGVDDIGARMGKGQVQRGAHYQI